MQANWPFIALYFALLAVLVWWCHAHGLELARRWYFRFQGLCDCGREEQACACPTEEVWTFTPWSEMDEDERDASE